MKISRHFTSTVFIVENCKLLLLDHLKLRSWLPPGGHLEENELPHEAALREVFEETGLEIILYHDKGFEEDRNYFTKIDQRAVPITKPWQLLLEQLSSDHYHIDFLFLARLVNPTQQEISDVKTSWFSAEELEVGDNIFPNVKYYGQKAIYEISSRKP